MNIYPTLIEAVDPIDGLLKKWAGPDIKAESFEAAKEFCQLNDLGYCEVKNMTMQNSDATEEEVKAFVDPKEKVNIF